MDDANQHIVPRVAIKINSVCVCVCALMVMDYFVSLLYVPNGLIPFHLIKEMFSSSLHILSFLILIFYNSQLFWLSLLTAWNWKKFKLLTFNSLGKSIPHDTFSQNSKPQHEIHRLISAQSWKMNIKCKLIEIVVKTERRDFRSNFSQFTLRHAQRTGTNAIYWID